MTFWRTNRVIERYNDGLMGDSEKFFYYLGGTALIGLVNVLIDSSHPGSSHAGMHAFGLVVTMIGLPYVFSKSRSADSTHFIEKLVILLLPTTIQFVAIFYPLYFVFYLLAASPIAIVREPFGYFLILDLVGWTLFYLNLGRKIVLMTEESASESTDE